MKYIDEFRNIGAIRKLARAIREIAPSQNISIMEVCGTHTQSFRRFGLGRMLPPGLRLIAGPGCPVCVSPQDYIDQAIELARKKDVLILSFGDMLRVPGTSSTLEKERARFGNVRVIYSPLDSLTVAGLHPHKKIVLLAVGFETTAPTIALSMMRAKKEGLRNIFFLCSLKLIPPAMAQLAQDPRLNLNGFLCPGHVSAIIGLKPYELLVKKYGIGCCIAGFEPLDMMEGLYLLLRQIGRKKPGVDNQYARVVKIQGNPKAKKIINHVFRVSDNAWRGLGVIPKSGLSIRKEFARFDAQREFSLKRINELTNQRKTKCKCADVLKGIVSPPECPLFSKGCTPDHPIGACMVSSEGACHAYYKYR
ncbi:MAG: hydrogenase formation protein HypD [Candidatus Omnitrophota bacterium]